MAIDFVMKRTLEREPTGIQWNFKTKLEDLDFADDLPLLSSKYHDIQKKQYAIGVGLKNYSRKRNWLNTNIRQQVQIDGKTIDDVNTFTSLRILEV